MACFKYGGISAAVLDFIVASIKSIGARGSFKGFVRQCARLNKLYAELLFNGKAETRRECGLRVYHTTI